MSISETLKNTVDILNNIYEVADPLMQWTMGLKLCWTVFKDWIIYIFTFQWLNFSKFPIFLPHGSKSVFIDIPSITNLQSVNFFEIPSPPSEMAFLSGFFNCLFLYFPFSPVQFIWLRQIVLDRKSAGMGKAATIGILLGNLSFFGFCLFGFRDIINAWFGLEPMSYFFGILLTFLLIFDMAHKPLIASPSQIQRIQKIQMVAMMAALVWTDPPGFYLFFGNFSLHSGITPIDFVQSPYFYFFGIFLGSLFWTFVIRISLSYLGEIFPRLTKFPSSYWIRGFNYFCLIGSISATLSSFHYYGIDYLFANPAGFVPQDSVWEVSNFPLPRLNLTTERKDTSNGRLGEKSNYQSLDTDLSTFDRGRYKGGPVVESHFESLNYQEEYAWRGRVDRASSRRRGERFFDPADHLSEEALLFRQNKRQEKRRIQQQKKLAKLQKQKQKISQGTPIRTLMPPVEDYLERPTEDEFGGDSVALVSSSPETTTSPAAGLGDASLPAQPKAPRDVATTPESSQSASDEESSDEEFDGLVSVNEGEEEEGLIERFVEDYAAEANLEDNAVPDLENEKIIYYSAFGELDKFGFDLFSIFEPIEMDPLDDELAVEMKEKYSENFVNRFWLNIDISNFSKRQLYKLSSTDEISLFDKRLALGEYYDTLRSYAYLPIPKNYQSLFCGPKSYVNRIYNQQFKGTFKFVERLFEIHLEDEQNIPPLLPPEDLYEDFEIVVANSRNTPEENMYLKLKKDASVLKFDQPLYKKEFSKKNPLIHEQFLDQMELSQQEADSTPFLSESKPLPFFVGWDRSQRKFLVTNRLLTRQKTLRTSTIPDGTFKFTAWPLTKKALQKNKLFSRLYRTAEEIPDAVDDVFSYFEAGVEPLDQEVPPVVYKTLPSIVKRIEVKSPERLDVSLAPKRGGFIWPGHQSSKYQLTFQLPNISLSPLFPWLKSGTR